MWPKEQLIFAKEEKGKWKTFVAKDPNGGKKELIWLFVSVDGKHLMQQFYYSTNDDMSEENIERYRKAFSEFCILLPKLYGQCLPKKMKPAIEKILQRNLKWYSKDSFKK